MTKDESSSASQQESIATSEDLMAIAPEPQNFIERALKPAIYIPRYPKWMVGKPLLWATCFFGSLGDALFGYDQGIMSGLLVNEVFIKRFYSDHGGIDGTTHGINPNLIGKYYFVHLRYSANVLKVLLYLAFNFQRQSDLSQRAISETSWEGKGVSEWVDSSTSLWPSFKVSLPIWHASLLDELSKVLVLDFSP